MTFYLPPKRRHNMPDGNHAYPHCANCYAPSHDSQHCPYNDEEADHVD